MPAFRDCSSKDPQMLRGFEALKPAEKRLVVEKQVRQPKFTGLPGIPTKPRPWCAGWVPKA